MSIQQKKGNVEDKLNEKDVEDFLRQNPEFFIVKYNKIMIPAAIHKYE